MDLNQIMSKKLGVVTATIVSLVLLVKEQPEIAGQVAWHLTVIVISYILIQGVIDLRKGDNS